MTRLCSLIDVLFDQFSEHEAFSMHPFEWIMLKSELMTEQYALSPLEIHMIPKESTLSFVQSHIDSRPDMFIYIIPFETAHSVFVFPRNTDGLFFMALAYLLNPTLKQEKAKMEKVISEMQKLERVDRLYIFCFVSSFRDLPLCLICEVVESVIGNRYFMNLFLSLFSLPIIEAETKTQRTDLSFSTISPCCELTIAVLDLLLDQIWDQEFLKRFPGIRCFRVNGIAYLAATQEDSLRFNSVIVKELLATLRLSADIVCIAPDSGVLPCNSGGILKITSDGRIRFIEPPVSL